MNWWKSCLLKSQLQTGIVKTLSQNINGLVKKWMKVCKIPGVNLSVLSTGNISDSLVNRTTVTFIYYSVEQNILLVKLTFDEYSKKISTVLRIPNAKYRIHKNSPLDDTANKVNLMRTHLRHII